MKIGPE